MVQSCDAFFQIGSKLLAELMTVVGAGGFLPRKCKSAFYGRVSLDNIHHEELTAFLNQVNLTEVHSTNIQKQTNDLATHRSARSSNARKPTMT